MSKRYMKKNNPYKSSYQKTFSTNLTKFRNEKGYTQKEISNLLNIKQESYSRYEKEKVYPKPDMIEKMAKILGVTPNDFLRSSNVEYEISENKDEIEVHMFIPKESVKEIDGNLKEETQRYLDKLDDESIVLFSQMAKMLYSYQEKEKFEELLKLEGMKGNVYDYLYDYEGHKIVGKTKFGFIKQSVNIPKEYREYYLANELDSNGNYNTTVKTIDGIPYVIEFKSSKNLHKITTLLDEVLKSRVPQYIGDVRLVKSEEEYKKYRRNHKNEETTNNKTLKEFENSGLNISKEYREKLDDSNKCLKKEFVTMLDYIKVIDNNEKIFNHIKKLENKNLDKYCGLLNNFASLKDLKNEIIEKYINN